MKSTVVITTCLLLASGAAFADGISLNFASDDSGATSEIANTTNTAGAIAVAGSNWNNLPGANGSAVSVITDNDGNALSDVTVSWSSNNTWRSASTGATATSENGALTKGYLDDGGGVNINFNSPYLLNDIYVMHGTDQANPAVISAVSVNGTFYKGNGAGGTVVASGSGDSWSAPPFSTADTLIESDNYIKVLSQPSVSVQTFASSPGRASLAGLQVENAYTGTLSYWDIDSTTAGAGGASPAGNWADANWSASAAGDAVTSTWTSGDAAVFAAGADATGVYTVTLSGTENVDAIWVQEGLVTLTGGTVALGGSGILRGDDPLAIFDGLVIDSTVTGTNVSTSGNVTLNGSGNNITGLMSINGETLLGADNTWGQVGGGGTLDLDAYTLTAGDATDSFGPSIIGNIGSSLVKTGSGTLTLGNVLDTLDGLTVADGKLTLTGGGNANWTLAGAGTLEKTGGGTLAIDTTTNTAFTGKTIVSGGFLRIPSQDTLGDTPASPVADHITLSGGARLQGGDSFGGADVTLDANRGIALDGGNSGFHTWTGFTMTVNGDIDGTANLTKSDGGTLVFNGTSTHDGDTRVEGGTLDVGGTISNSDNLRLTGTSTLRIGPGANITTNRIVTADGGSAQSTITHDGGILNVIGTNNANNTGASILFGHWGAGAASSTYNLSAGELNSLGAEMSFGWDSANVTMNQTGGTANLLGLDLANGRNNAATYNLEGGTLNIGANGITNASNKTVNVGGGTLGSLASWSSAKPLVLSGVNGDATITANGSDTINLTGTLSGPGGLIKTGTGTLALSGTPGTYSGSTQVLDGTLFFSGDASSTSAVLVATGASIGAGSPTNQGSAIVESLELAAGSSSSFRLGNGSSDLIDVFQTDGLNVTGNHTISFQPVGTLAVGEQFTLIDYDGTIQGLGFAGFTAAAFPNPHYMLSLVDNSANTSVDVSVDDITEITWTGAAGTAWDFTAVNWDDGTLASLFYDADIVNFIDTVNANESVVVDDSAGAISPASMMFSTTTTTFTISGDPISGLGGLTKTGPGTVIFTNDNTFTGGVDIQEGTIQMGDGGTTGSFASGGTTTVAPGAQLVFNHSDAKTLDRTNTGGGTLVKNGANNLTVTSSNNAVAMVINDGTLLARGGNWPTSFNGGNPITVNSGGTLDTVTHSMGGLGGATLPSEVNLNGGTWFFNNEQYMNVVNFTAGTTTGPGELRTIGGGIYTVNADANPSVMGARLNMVGGKTIQVADGAADPDLLISGAIVGGAGLTFSGPGRVVSSGANSSTGPIFLPEGRLAMTGDNSARTGGYEVTGGTLEATSMVDAGIGSGYLALKNGTLEYLGTGIEATNRILWIDAAGQSGTFDIVDAGAVLTMSPSGGTVNQPVIKNGAGRLVLNGAIGGDATVTVNAGRLDLGGANTYTGATTVETGATLVMSLPTIDDSASVLINGTGKIDLNHGANDVIGELLIDGVAQAAGTYGATGSGATNIDDVHFSGSGTLEIVSANDYDTWAASFGLDPLTDGAPGADPDGDGVPNSEEYAFALDPTDPGSANAIFVPLDQATGTFSYTRRDPSLTGLTYTYDSSTTLTVAGWTAFTPDAEAPSGSPVQTVVVTVPAGLLANPVL
ncbi:MAG: hypothetical protein HKO57_15505, partial [Akkermansiaceae bacterium]|nr:hypothetical protein [Akkermansiaceae bacterium]